MYEEKNGVFQRVFYSHHPDYLLRYKKIEVRAVGIDKIETKYIQSPTMSLLFDDIYLNVQNNCHHGTNVTNIEVMDHNLQYVLSRATFPGAPSYGGMRVVV